LKLKRAKGNFIIKKELCQNFVQTKRNLALCFGLRETLGNELRRGMGDSTVLEKEGRWKWRKQMHLGPPILILPIVVWKTYKK